MTRYLFGFICVLALGVMPLVGCSETSGEGGSGGSAGTGGTGGSGGTAGTGGSGGTGGSAGTGGVPCEGPQDCNDGNDCTGNTCTNGMCEYTPVEDGTECDESNECTVGTCIDGACDSAPVADGTACDESNECTVGTCAGGSCDATPVADGTACGNDAGTCQQGSCSGAFACTEQGIRDAIAVGGGPHTFECDGAQTVVIEDQITIDNNVILDGEGNLTVDGDQIGDPAFSVNEEVTAELTRFTVIGGTCVPDFKCSPAVIHNSGTLTLTNSVLSNNQAGAGLRNSAVGMATLVDCTLSGNVGGGIVNFGNLTLTNSTVSDNENWGIRSASGTLTLTSTKVLGNRGVGVHNEGAMATLMECTVAGNMGRGIYNAAGTLTVLSTIVSDNDTGIDSGLAGGGIDNDGTVVVVNSTISENTATRGGGIFNEGSLTLLSSTLANNIATTGTALSTGQSGPDRDYVTMIGSTLIEGNCSNGQPIDSTGYNVESPGDTCGFDLTTDKFDVTEAQLNLGPLADNGGPTMTHALGLLPTPSVAIDVIPVDSCEVDTDQRGDPRPGGTMCDVGAFEVQP